MSATTLDVNSQSDLNSAISTVDGATSGASYVIQFQSDITETSDLLAINAQAGVSVTIDGGTAFDLDGASTYQGLFVYAGAVTIQNLTIQNVVAQGGAGGVGGGGGGAGLGGAIFVASAGSVTLNDVTVINASAVGGAGASNVGGSSGGGGGLGGAGASQGGGGGVGNTANGAPDAGAGSAGIVQGAGPGGANGTNLGGLSGGGGGGGSAGGGGGGVSGGAGGAGVAGAGGFGGGGGGGNNGGVGGAGGFGGGGGASSHFRLAGGAGGFGGGGGGGGVGIGGAGGAGGAAGFGAGAGAAGVTNGFSGGAGGGGLGAGGDIFVQAGGTLIVEGGNLSSGNVVGGSSGIGGGSSASGGSAYGSGIFLQGSETVTLDPGASTTLTVGGVIADQGGSGGTGTGGLIVSGGGTVQLQAVNTYTGSTSIGGNSVLEIGASGSDAASTADFASTGTIQFDAVGSVVGGITDFNGADSDVLHFIGISPGSVTIVQTVNNAATIDGMVVAGTFGTLTGVSDGSGGTIITACYRQGTRIATDRGDIPIEALEVGDMARTASGCSRTIIWIGSRTVPLADHPRPHDVMPVRVQAAAFGPGQPVRDLFLSPDHAVHVDGVLIPIRYLLNGASIRQEPAEQVTWWHLELDTHDIVLAEGLPAESYLDTGNRSAFDGGEVVVRLHPDFARDTALAVWDEAACAPLATGGEVVRAVRARLLARLPALGHATTYDPAVCVLSGATRLGIEVEDDWIALTVPEGVDAVRLVSRTARPAERDLASDDWRCLGLAVTALTVDGEGVALDDARLGDGWLAAEPTLRWTSGDATIAVAPGSTLRFHLWKCIEFHIEAPRPVARERRWRAAA